MTIQCPQCQHQMSTGGNLPRFCSNCGASLAELTGQLNLADATSAKTTNQPPLDVTAQFQSTSPSRTPGSNATQNTQAGEIVPANLEPGSVVGRFEIEKTLGAGGMGTVYQASDQSSGQRVALKLLSRSVRTTDETIQRFQRESQIAASINHPRSTFVYGAGQHEGQFFITMELMTGGTLDDIVKRDGPIEVGVAVDYVIDMIDGLRAAHEAGIVHRDLKPSNCFIDHVGRVKIGDFGLAKSFQAESSLTQTGAFMGTPQYAAPEQLRTSEVDERADIYAIGGTLFYLLVGRPPFVGNAAQVISSIASEMPPRVSDIDKSIPRKLCRIINQTLEKRPERRPENLEELRQALLPHSSRGATAADPGRRLAAFFMDVFLIGLMIGLGGNVLGIFLQVIPNFDMNLASMVLSVSAGLAYFTTLEYWFGTTFGKWLLGMRTTTMNNRAPSFVSCLIRAMIMPGLMYLAHSAPAYLLDLDPTAVTSVDAIVKKATIVILFQLGGWVLSAILFVGARKENGYRGIHETISGTRVVRVSGTLESYRMHNIPVTIPISTGMANAMKSNTVDETLDFVSPQVSGEFKIAGELGRLHGTDCSVLLGRDESLDRDVWVLDSPPQAIIDAASRSSGARAVRMRILGVNDADHGRSVITEAIKGMPMAEFLRVTPNVDWRAFRPVLQELAGELALAEKDGSLPAKLCLAQIWIEEAGHPKLLEHPIDAVAEGLVDQPKTSDEQQRWNNEQQSLKPAELIKALLNVFVRHHQAPAHVLTFREEVDVLDLEKDGMTQIGDRLRELAEMPSAWKWDDRLGAMAISIGMELSIVSSLSIAAVMLVALIEPGVIAMSVGMFVVSSLIAIVGGALSGGGVAFKISGVLVRENKTLQPASQLRTGLRTWVAWLPVIIGITGLSAITARNVVLAHHQPEITQVIDFYLIASVLATFLMFFVAFLCSVFSILRPSRGIQDLVCGTRLIRK